MMFKKVQLAIHTYYAQLSSRLSIPGQRYISCVSQIDDPLMPKVEIYF